MSDEILEQTTALRDAARAELEASPAYIRFQALDDAVRKMTTFSGQSPPIAARSTARRQLVPSSILEIPVVEGRRRISQAEGAIAILREAKKPLSTPEIVAALPRVGASAGGENPDINVSSSLSRDARINSVRIDGKSMWWLADEPLPRNETEPVDFDDLLGSDSPVTSGQKGGDGHGPATT